MKLMRLNPIKTNMTELELDGGFTVLFSYKTPVAVIINGFSCRKTDKHWSKTTTEHINQWFRDKGNIKEVNEYPQEYFDHLVGALKV